MSETFDVALVTLMWGIVVVRGAAMRHTQGHLLMWVALISGIISITVAQTEVGAWITVWTGTPAVAFVLDTVLALFAVSWVNTFFLAAATSSSSPAWRRRQWYPWLLTLPTALTLTIIAFTERLETYATYQAASEQRATVPQVLALCVYELTLLAHLTVMVSLFAALSRRETNTAVRWAFRAVTLTTVGVGSRAIYTLATMSVPNQPWPWDTQLVLWSPMPGYVVGFIAITVLGLVTLAQQRSMQRRLTALQPLSKALIMLPRRRQRIHDVPAQQALIARYTEIEDSLRYLRERSTAEALALAQRYVQGRRVIGSRRREAIATAAWISLSLKQLADNVALAKTPTPFPYQSTGSFLRDIDRLTRVANALDHPLVDAFVDACDIREGRLYVRGLTPTDA